MKIPMMQNENGKGFRRKLAPTNIGLVAIASLVPIAMYTGTMNSYLGQIIDMREFGNPSVALLQNTTFGQWSMAENESIVRSSTSEQEKEQQKALDILHELDILTGGPQAKDLECPPPLVPFQNVVVRRPLTARTTATHANHANSTDTDTDTAVAQNGLIPNIIHFTYKSRCLPQDLAAVIERWKKKLPNHSIFFHDDVAVKRLLDLEWSEFSTLHRAMKCILYSGAMTIDVWRILIVYKYGGIYSDIDTSPSKGFTENIIRPHFSGFFFSDPWNRPSQWCFAFEPGHPILYLTVYEIIERLYQVRNIRRPKVIHVTGPMALRSGWLYFLEIGPVLYEDKYKPMEYKGPFNKTVAKFPAENNTDVKFGFSDLVPSYNSTKVTRQKRIELEGGQIHWKRRIDSTTLSAETDISCLQYLEKLDDNPTNELNYSS